MKSAGEGPLPMFLFPQRQRLDLCAYTVRRFTPTLDPHIVNAAYAPACAYTWYTHGWLDEKSRTRKDKKGVCKTKAI